MATIDIVETSGRVETHVRGRVFRQQPRGAQRPVHAQPARKQEPRRICVLSHRGGRELEHWGISQPCFGPGCTHRHYTRAQVDALVKDGILAWCGTGKAVAKYVYARSWRGVQSPGPDGPKVMQLV